jgi:hypothetical protein
MPETGIDAGDAIVSFLADTTQLDEAFTKLDATPARLSGASAATDQLGSRFEDAGEKASDMGEEVEEAAESTKVNMGAARGEVALLGEEFGIRLPRHVRSFVAELPGVGAALQSAFAATAILFLLEALVKGSEKLSEFIAELTFGTAASKKQEESVIDLNKALIPLRDQYDKLKTAVDNYGKSQVQLATQGQKQAKESVEELTKALAADTEAVKKNLEATQHAGRSTLLWAEAWDKVKSGDWLNALKGLTVGIDTTEEANKNLGESQNKLTIDSAKLKLANEEVADSAHKVTEALTKAAEANQKMREKEAELFTENRKLEEGFERNVKVTLAVEEITSKAGEAARAYGQALRILGIDTGQLTGAVERDTAALKLAEAAYQRGEITSHQINEAHIVELRSLKALTVARGQDTKAIDEQITFYQKFDNGVSKSTTFMDAFTADFKKKAKETENAAQDMGNMVGTSLAKMDTAYASAIVSAFTEGKSIGAAMEQATKAVVTQLATQALAKAMYYTAEGIALSFTDPAASSAAFAAAGEFALVAGIAGAGAMAMSGGSSAGGPTSQVSSPNTNTGGNQNAASGGPVTNRMAAGGLVTGPTLAMIGEGVTGSTNRPTEAVLPLDNEGAMEKLRSKLGGGSQDNSVHFHKGAGLVSPDNLKKVMKQMSGMVKKRTARLHSTNTFRTQKRST